MEDGQRDVSERRVPGVKYSIEKLFDIIERGIFRAAAGYESHPGRREALGLTQEAAPPLGLPSRVSRPGLEARSTQSWASGLAAVRLPGPGE